MNYKTICLKVNLLNFSKEVCFSNELSYKENLNLLFSSILPQKDNKYSFSFREEYYSSLINQINSNLSFEEKEILILNCLFLSYRDYLENYIEDIIKKYNFIKKYKSEYNYINYFKYRLEVMLFSFIVLFSEKNYEESFIVELREIVEEGNIKFQDY